MYQHFVCGLKIGNIDYTVHSIIAVDRNGDRYYDHNLSYIEKGKLLDLINKGKAVYKNGFGTTPDTKSTTNSLYKDKNKTLNTKELEEKSNIEPQKQQDDSQQIEK